MSEQRSQVERRRQVAHGQAPETDWPMVGDRVCYKPIHTKRRGTVIQRSDPGSNAVKVRWDDDAEFWMDPDYLVPLID